MNSTAVSRFGAFESSAIRDIERDLGRARRHAARVGGHASDHLPAALPAKPLDDRLERGGHRARLRGVHERDAAREARVAEVRPLARLAKPELGQQRLVVDDAESRQRGAEPVLLGIEQRGIADLVLAVGLGKPLRLERDGLQDAARALL
ncbi:MAG: hypothetical protein LW636_10795, partial [Planctomycetaceae bacterium]|nr:hypothetical protein [Planctomycetaceae bacterium]